MKKKARFYNIVGQAYISFVREVDWPLRRVETITEVVPESARIDFAETSETGPIPNVRTSKANYRVVDYGVKLPFQEERYARVYLHVLVTNYRDPALLKKIAKDFGWPGEVIPKGGM